MYRFGIKQKILVLVFAAIVSITLLQTFYIFNNHQQEMETIIETSLVQSAIDSAQRVSTLLSSRFNFLEALATSTSIRSLDASTINAFRGQYNHSLFDQLSFIDANGRDVITNMQYSETYLPYSQSILGRTYISDVYFSEAMGKEIIALSVPIIEDRNVVGVLIGFLDARSLSQIINEYNGHSNSYAYIINNDNQIIAHHDFNYVTSGYDVNDIDDWVIELFNFKHFYKHSLLGNIGYGSYKKNNKNILAAYSKINLTNWRVYIASDKTQIFASSIHTQQIFLLISGIVLAIGLVASLMVANRIANPLINLSNKFNEATQGDLSVRSYHNSDDEIGIVSKSFNSLMNKINQLTFFDSLTGLPNSNILIQDLNNPGLNSKGATSTLALISIDRFTKINEVHGMAAGDSILYEISTRIDASVGDKGELYKGRGDEFFIVLRQLDCSAAEAICHQLHSDIHRPYTVDETPIMLHFSIGLVSYLADTIPASRLINHVTHANLLSKADSHQPWRWYSENTHQLDMQNADIEIKLFKAIENEEFHLVYQPVIAMDSNTVSGAEALIRWENEQLGKVSTEKFIKLAEDNSFIKRIDRWVFEAACQQLNAWNSHLKLSVNISALTFEDGDFVDFVAEMLQTYHIDPQYLQIELTERVILNQPVDSVAKMKQLNDMGIRFALDDFGIGYSSLSYLIELPIDIVKIDRSFVQNIGRDIHATAVVNAIITMCQDIGLAILAEGVETVNEVAYLSAKHCSYAQGYYYNKPLEVDVFERYYSNYVNQTKTSAISS